MLKKLLLVPTCLAMLFVVTACTDNDADIYEDDFDNGIVDPMPEDNYLDNDWDMDEDDFEDEEE